MSVCPHKQLRRRTDKQDSWPAVIAGIALLVAVCLVLTAFLALLSPI